MKNNSVLSERGKGFRLSRCQPYPSSTHHATTSPASTSRFRAREARARDDEVPTREEVTHSPGQDTRDDHIRNRPYFIFHSQSHQMEVNHHQPIPTRPYPSQRNHDSPPPPQHQDPQPDLLALPQAPDRLINRTRGNPLDRRLPTAHQPASQPGSQLLPARRLLRPIPAHQHERARVAGVPLRRRRRRRVVARRMLGERDGRLRCRQGPDWGVSDTSVWRCCARVTDGPGRVIRTSVHVWRSACLSGEIYIYIYNLAMM
ncbi:hypothetical protein F4780DRAFT_188084 [Xylariomycetidae sp. FL0641]|nr:hypothetical protein F4780DRAFT_188084 [Xylariomycetidae sp. FL0641]